MSYKNHSALPILQKHIPQASQAWYVGACEFCGNDVMIFGVIGEIVVNERGYVEGGWYCPRCKFSNAGGCRQEKLR